MIQLVDFWSTRKANEWLMQNKHRKIFSITSSYNDDSFMNEKFKIVIAYYTE